MSLVSGSTCFMTTDRPDSHFCSRISLHYWRTEKETGKKRRTGIDGRHRDFSCDKIVIKETEKDRNRQNEPDYMERKIRLLFQGFTGNQTKYQELRNSVFLLYESKGCRFDSCWAHQNSPRKVFSLSGLIRYLSPGPSFHIDVPRITARPLSWRGYPKAFTGCTPNDSSPLGSAGEG